MALTTARSDGNPAVNVVRTMPAQPERATVTLPDTTSATGWPTSDEVPDPPRESSGSGWLTTVFRPAGTLNHTEAGDLAAALEAVAGAADVLVLDLRSVMPLPREARRGITRAHERLTASGGVMIVIDPDHVHELSHDILDVSAALPLPALDATDPIAEALLADS